MTDQDKPSESILKDLAEQMEDKQKTLEANVLQQSKIPDLSGQTPYSNMPSSPLQGAAATPESPKVVVPSFGNNLPKWFYLLFLIVVAVFIIVTILLVRTVNQKKRGFLPTYKIPPTVTSGVNMVKPTSIPFRESTDAAVLKINNLGTSDKQTDLQIDVENTDLSLIEQVIATLDGQMDFDTILSR